MFETAGFSGTQTVLTLASMALLLASIGVAGLYLGVPDFAMILLFFVCLVGYYCTVSKCWSGRQFLGNEICRRSGKDRRDVERQIQGECQRRGDDRRD